MPPVGGMLAPDEAPLAAAKRELLAETGCKSPDWVHLGSHILDPDRGIATMHLFLALNAPQVADPDSDDLEDQEMLLLSREEVKNVLAAGDRVLAWAAVVAMALNYLNAADGPQSGEGAANTGGWQPQPGPGETGIS